MVHCAIWRLGLGSGGGEIERVREDREREYVCVIYTYI